MHYICDLICEKGSKNLFLHKSIAIQGNSITVFAVHWIAS